MKTIKWLFNKDDNWYWVMVAVFIAGYLFAIILSGISPAKAGLLDDIKDAVSGHVEDVKDRLTTDNEFVDGQLVSIGNFNSDTNDRDRLHYVNGTVSIVFNHGAYYVQLHEDFKTGLAPDLYIYVSEWSNIKNAKFFNQVKQYELAKLKSGSGATFYAIPMDLDIASVTIWCKRFGVYMGSANLYNN